jgi:C-terminal processing protease CtpA/Prc
MERPSSLQQDGVLIMAYSIILQGGSASFSGQVNVSDVIVSVDGRPCRDIHPDQISMWFLGEPGTAVLLVMADPLSGWEREVRLVRQPLARVGSFNGEVAGIGAVLASDTLGNIVVAKLVYGGAAAQVKPSDLFGEDRLKRYDIIVDVDGKDVRGLTPADLRPMLVGPVGSIVRLKVKRAKYDIPIDIELRRKATQMQASVR